MAKTTIKTPGVCKTNTVKVAHKHIGLVQKDLYLEPFEDAIRGRHDHAEWKKNQLTAGGKKTLGNEKIIFDVSHCDQGYVMVKYLGNNPKVKVRINSYCLNQYPPMLQRSYGIF